MEELTSNSDAVSAVTDNGDGTITVTNPGSGTNLISNCSLGLGAKDCILTIGKFFYTSESGGRGPLISTDQLGTSGSATYNLPLGYYTGTNNVTFRDSDLVAANLKVGINLFGVNGSLSSSLVANSCNLDTQPITASAGSPCAVSSGLYVYASANGGRSQVCNLNNASLNQNNCWIDEAVKVFLTETEPIILSACVLPASPNPQKTTNQCIIGSPKFVYTSEFGGRSNLCSTDESVNSQTCWADQISGVKKGFVTKNVFANWCKWDQQTTTQCRVRINVTNEGSSYPAIKSIGYVYETQFGGRNILCTNNNDGFCWTSVTKTDLERNLTPDVIKAGVMMFGVEGKFRGEGSWKSGAHRDSYAYPVALSDEAYFYGGGGKQNTGLPDGYREVPISNRDTDVIFSSEYSGVDRTGWGYQTCGTGSVDDLLPSGYSTWTLRARVAHCADIFGLNSIWNGVNQGNASQSKWKLVSRSYQESNVNPASKMFEVWMDDNTGMLWSSLVFKSNDWCKASGNSQTPCDNPSYQPATGNKWSACYEASGFTSSGINENGAKAGLGLSSSLTVGWRIPTLFDYEVAEYNGIQFVLPDIGKALATNSAQFEWTGTSKKGDLNKAWLVSSKLGKHSILNKTMTAGVRCIGRVNTIN